MRVWKEQNFNFGFLRNPRKHVYSQFLECKYDNWGKGRTKDTNFPRNATDPEDMADWVSFFHDDWNVTKGCFNTYNPINMQSRWFVCNYGNPAKVVDEFYLTPNIDHAITHAENLDFLGKKVIFR